MGSFPSKGTSPKEVPPGVVPPGAVPGEVVPPGEVVGLVASGAGELGVVVVEEESAGVFFWLVLGDGESLLVIGKAMMAGRLFPVRTPFLD